MIIHRYSEYEEPERPPFTLEDVIRAITDMMMRHHVDFGQALQYLLERGLPINQFLRDDAMDEILDSFINQVEDEQRKLRSRHDWRGLTEEQRRRLASAIDKLRKKMDDDPEFLANLREAERNRTVAKINALKWNEFRKDEDPIVVEGLDEVARILESLEDIERFNDSFGREFTGKERLDRQSAAKVAGQYEALEALKQELIDAKERGNLFGVNEERLREALGDEAYEEFSKARDSLMDKLSEVLQSSGQVEERDGIFKLTPAAARKVGHTALREVYENLKTDGAGAHAVTKPGEGSLEKVNTRPYQYGDSITHMDVTSSMMNALRREGAELPIRIRAEDFEIHDTHGVAKSSLVVMMDMSGSMSRFGRFYNAKKMALAFDSLVRKHYPEDSVSFVGFATFARDIRLGEIMDLAPEPITFWGGGVRMEVDFARLDDPERELGHVPRYFTNIQKGLEMARRRLSAEPGLNKEIFLITDGAPTAYYEDGALCLSYPPEERGYSATLKEVRACADEGININVFLLGSDFDTGFYGEDAFIMRMMKACKGRLFHPEPDSLTKYVLIDYVTNKRRMIEV